MPIECTLLKDQPSPITTCPKCGVTPFDPFLRGSVQRSKYTLFSWPPFKLRDYCSLICSSCQEIVGYESPPYTKHL